MQRHLAEHFGAKSTFLYIDTTLYLEAYFRGSYGYPALRPTLRGQPGYRR